MLSYAYLSITTVIRVANKRNGHDKETKDLYSEDIKNDAALIQAKKELTKMISYEALYEANPQVILQAYTLWKRPLKCFEASVGNLGKYALQCFFIFSC